MKKLVLAVVLVWSSFAVPSHEVEAATLRLSPNTGVYTAGNIFTVTVSLNTLGKSANAVDGRITFNPSEVQVVSATRSGSIFNLWTEEPTFSNTAGTVSFGGGSPTGYKGASGNVMSITFRTLAAGTPKIEFQSGSVLAADGMGTNILTGMSGGTYTVSAQVDNPEPEYVAPANTPKAPVITSTTHPNENMWYTKTTVELAWELPSDVTAVRMLLDEAPNTIPTNVYEERLTSRTIDDLDEGVSYFHLQFRNGEGWGKVAHYTIGVDVTPPEAFTIEVTDTPEGAKGTTFAFSAEDISPIREYKIQIDGSEPIIFVDEDETGQYIHEGLFPGHHTIVVEAIDSAGNSSISSLGFTVDAFDAPVFTEYPSRINTEVIPALSGTTKPDVAIAVEIRRVSDGQLVHSEEIGTDESFTIRSDANGNFIFIPDGTFDIGVYEIIALARDDSGSLSERSEPIRLVVEVPGYIAVGNMMIQIFSIIVPLIALALLSIFGTWYIWLMGKRWRRKVTKETREVEEMLKIEFAKIVKNLDMNVSALTKSRKGKLTKAEMALIEQIQDDIEHARATIKAEVDDIENVLK